MAGRLFTTWDSDAGFFKMLYTNDGFIPSWDSFVSPNVFESLCDNNHVINVVNGTRFFMLNGNRVLEVR